MHLRFSYDEEHKRFVSRFRLGRRYTGPPGHAHGGVIATILDEAMGKVNKIHNVVALTSEISVHYLKPVPLNKPLRVEARGVSVRGRRHINAAEILNQRGEVLASSRGTFIAIDPHRMFAKFVDR
ncbi:MAG TPA: PaaI family thioesterase [Terriglobales bacterium]|nr:PaaI family thioesterase [Terriglobales bacterium]